MLTCIICHTVKPLHLFHKQTSSKNGHDPRCIPCKKIQRDAERQTEEYRSWDTSRHALWILENPGKAAIGRNIRRTKEDQQIATWTKGNKQELRAIAGLYKEAKTLNKAYNIDFHVDHIVPLNSPFVSGFTCINNMEVLTGFANISKGNRWWPDMQEVLCLEEIERDSRECAKRLKKTLD